MRNVTLYNNAVTRRGFRCEYFIFNGWASLAHKRMTIPNDITYCGISENVSGQRLQERYDNPLCSLKLWYVSVLADV